MTAIIIRTVSIILWILFVGWMIYLLQCNSQVEGFSNFESIFKQIVELDKKLNDIESYLRDENMIFNKLEKRDERQESGFSKMSTWIVNKHKSMIEVERKKKEAEEERKIKEYKEAEERKNKPKQEEEKKESPITPENDTERYFTVEPFNVSSGDSQKLVNAATYHYIRFQKIFQIVITLYNSIRPLIEWKNYVTTLRSTTKSNQTREKFLDYEGLAKEELESGKLNNPTPSMVEQKPYNENVVSRLTYQLKLDRFDKSIKDNSFRANALNAVSSQYNIHKARVINLEEIAHLYNFELTEIYDLYQDEIEFEKQQVGKATDIAKDEYKKQLDSATQGYDPNKPLESEDIQQNSGKSNALLGTVTNSTGNMNINEEEKKTSNAATSSIVSDVTADMDMGVMQ